MGVPLYTASNFAVVRQIANHTDTGTYYVRAVIRNAYTDVTVDTLNLEDKGGQRFKKNWKVPADPSGEGFYVSIITSVYTDSGYTTKSENYGDEENTYLITDKPRTLGGGGGSGIDYLRLRNIVKEEVEKIVFPEIPAFPKIPKTPAMRWDEVLTAIETVESAVKKLPTKTVELEPVLSKIQSVKEAVDAKEVTPATDISTLDKKIDELLESMENNHAEAKDSTSSFRKMLPKLIGENTTRAIELAKFNIEMPYRVPVKEKEKEPELDLTKLTQ